MVNIPQVHLKKQAKKAASQPIPQPRSCRRDEIEHGHRWDRWRYNQENLTLTLEWTNGPFDPTRSCLYDIDLEKCGTTAQMLDWICQVSRKCFVGNDDVANLVEAFKDLINPQQNLCSFGIGKTLDVKKHLGGYRKSRVCKRGRYHRS
jgi:hypothetical protein